MSDKKINQAERTDLQQKTEGINLLNKNDLINFERLLKNLRAQTNLIAFYGQAINNKNITALKLLDQYFSNGATYKKNLPWWVSYSIKTNQMDAFLYFYEKIKNPNNSQFHNNIVDLLRVVTRYNVKSILEFLYDEFKNNLKLNTHQSYLKLVKSAANHNQEELYHFWMKEFLQTSDGKSFNKKSTSDILTSAVHGGNLNIIKDLISKLKINQFNDTLYAAIKKKNLVIFEYILEQGADINHEQGRIMRWAALQEDKDLIKYLIKMNSTVRIEPSMMSSTKKNYHKTQSLVELCALEVEQEKNKNLSSIKINKL